MPCEVTPVRGQPALHSRSRPNCASQKGLPPLKPSTQWSAVSARSLPSPSGSRMRLALQTLPPTISLKTPRDISSQLSPSSHVMSTWHSADSHTRALGRLTLPSSVSKWWTTSKSSSEGTHPACAALGPRTYSSSTSSPMVSVRMAPAGGASASAIVRTAGSPSMAPPAESTAVANTAPPHSDAFAMRTVSAMAPGERTSRRSRGGAPKFTSTSSCPAACEVRFHSAVLPL
mmetsp:Transcript_8325/g.33727  ORF Transcript_8325/g.33727 Transcript_8325/m.33727 type:complete len:231 (-) Transcript_8325:626-1318(-)